MEQANPEAVPADTLVAALIYLMTRYGRYGSTALATGIAQHMQWLADHPTISPALRDTCARLHGAWSQMETAPRIH
jgi:hypothetical protein